MSPDSSTPAIRVKGLSKEFKLPHEQHSTLKSLALHPFKKRKSIERQKVLKDITFEVKEGEFLGIVGRNGGGKSTLLKLLAQIYDPTKGEIEINGKLVPFIELGVGFNPELSGRDNVYLNGAMLGFSDKEVDEMYSDIVEFSELERFMDQKLKNYSSGMQVRLAFSVATRAKADILLVDEVLAVGDSSFQRKCYDYFVSLKKANKTVIFISHDMAAVRQYCDRVILIDKGEIKQVGDAAKISEAYTRLFDTSSTGVTDSQRSDKEWGNGDIKLDKIDATIKSDYITVNARFRAIKELNDYVIGLSLKSADGSVVWGTNTELANTSTTKISDGELINVQFSFQNIFSDGTYTVDIAAHGYGGLPVFTWTNEALILTLQSGKTSPYSIAPKADINISKSK